MLLLFYDVSAWWDSSEVLREKSVKPTIRLRTRIPLVVVEWVQRVGGIAEAIG